MLGVCGDDKTKEGTLPTNAQNLIALTVHDFLYANVCALC